jgi:hypothetical protein
MEDSLEAELKTAPFETYALTRGSKNGAMGSTFKTVGKFKGLIRVILDEDEPSLFPPEVMEQILKPKSYKVRLYALKSIGLTGMDTDIFGNVAKSDPYLKVSLGKFKLNDRKNAINDATDVDHYMMVEIDVELPGTSQLQIKVMDKDDFGALSDDLIGQTTIDLEDRWFDSRWQDYGKENQILPGEGSDASVVRWQTKPIERRSLYTPSNGSAQGVIECWVDILTPEQAYAFPPDDVSLPPVQMFEVRVVIWKSKNVPPMDSAEGMSDLFVKCWPEGCDKQETDTHWRCKKGKASWNYRLLFDVELGQNTRAMKFPLFHLQLWDRDILKWNDCAGEGIIDIGKYYRKAYKRNVAIKLFEKKQGAAANRAKKTKKLKKKIIDTGDDIPIEEDTTTENGVEMKSLEDKSFETNPMITEDIDSDDDDDKSFGANTANTPKQEPIIRIDTGEQEPKKTKGWTEGWFGSKTDDEDEAEDPLLNDEGEANEQTEEEKKTEEDEDAQEMIQTIKGMTGLWDDDPPDSEWLNFIKADHNGGEPIPMGSVSYSIQIWPKDKSVAMPAGAARSDPNSNPYLPGPVGRLKFSLNPFVMGSELCGPVLCGKIFCCLMCLVFVVLMIFCQPFINILINVIFFCA